MVKAAICREFGAQLSIEEISLTAPLAHEIEVDIKACAVCHSDITFMDGGWGGSLPAVYGHEAAGIVTKIGNNVTSCNIGDHVCVTLIRSCGSCFYCDHGSQHLCDHDFPRDHNTPLHDKDNSPLHQAMRTGAFAEKVVVDQSQIVVIPKTLSMPVASLLSCGVITGFCAVTRTAKMPVGANAVVIGCGGVGLNTVQGATLSGAKNVIAVDIADNKLEQAALYGANHTLLGNIPDLAEQIHQICDGRGADFVFVTVGNAKIIDQAVTMLAKEGTVVIVGMPGLGAQGQYDIAGLAAYGQRIIGSKMGSAQIKTDIPYLISLYEQGRLQLDSLISNCYGLDDINKACDDVRNGSVYRNVIDMSL